MKKRIVRSTKQKHYELVWWESAAYDAKRLTKSVEEKDFALFMRTIQNLHNSLLNRLERELRIGNLPPQEPAP